MRNRPGMFWVLGVLGAFAFTPAQAQESTDFQVERFEPLPAQGTNILNTAKSEVLPHGAPSVGIFLNYMNDPLVLIETIPGEGDQEHTLLNHHLTGELAAAFGLWDVLDVGIVLPVVLYQSGTLLDGEDLGAVDIADIRVVPKFRLLNPDDFGGFGLALLSTVSLPTGGDYNTEGSLRFEPRVAFDVTNDAGFALAANLGYAFRDKKSARDYVADDLFRWSVGLELPILTKDIKVIGSLFGDLNVADQLDPNDLSQTIDNKGVSDVESAIGLQYEMGNLIMQAGAGSGFTRGVGSPDIRLFSSFSYTPRNRDADRDGILDEDDQCPQIPEDLDGFEDSDGCPELDNDQDGILDADDACINEPEDMDGFQDEDGCPDSDNDQDGILDPDDACPNDAGPEETQGCPDTDGDGIIDSEDKCPNDPEDFDEFEDEDGCPDPDNDQDTILDVDDKCPMDPEDMDGFEDEDGCPDPDNDQDGIPDKVDKCPFQPETINGNEDDDGCPDKGKSKVVITKTKIEILDKVFFDYNKATIKTRSFNLLNQVASIIKANPKVTKIRVEGHTDSKGNDEYNMNLSQERANSVLNYLKERGVDTNRLKSVGYGETKPIASNAKKRGRSQNRRVEFTILEIDGKAIGDGPAIIEKKEVIEGK